MTLSEIREQLERAAGPDREIDASLWLAFTPGATRKVTHVKHAHSDAEWDIDETRDAGGELVIVPAYTASVDAALGLFDRVLPRWEFRLSVEHPGAADASIWRAELGDPLRGWDAEAPTAPLSLLRTLLAALEADQNPKGEEK